MSGPSIETVSDLIGYFRDELDTAFETLGVDTSEETEAYLVHLLDGYKKIDPTTAEEVGFHRPAALMLAEALHCRGERRIEVYRRLGDSSLYSCGFFTARLRRGGISPDYYRRIGQTAYSNLSDLMNFKQPGGVFQVIYRELSTKFDQIADAFGFLAEKASTKNSGVLLDRTSVEKDGGGLDQKWWREAEKGSA